MKTIKWTIKITSILLLVSVMLFSCKKKKTAPTLTLNGTETSSLCLGDPYEELGASAIDAYGDNVDVVITGDVDIATVGNYIITYTATDKNDNVTSVETTVAVEMCASSLLGNYTIVSDCQVMGFDIVSADQEILPGLTANEFIIDNFNFAISQITASVEGSTITVPLNSFDYDTGIIGVITITISGVGTVNETGTEMIIVYTYDAGIAGSGTCTATYTKV